jgi:putative transcriptional regulator
VSNHPHRSRRTPSPARHPTPEAIRAARDAVGLTQRAAADLIYATERAWQAWEQGTRPMHPALWEYWGLRVTYPRASLAGFTSTQ